MEYDHILIRYGEISLKGRNRNYFLDQLQANVKRKLRRFEQVRVKKTRHRMFVVLNGQHPEPVMEELKDIFGIQSYSLAIRVNSEPEEIKKGALAALLEAGDIKTFKVTVKRPDKNFPIPSQEMNHVVGGYILKKTDHVTVDVHHPDVEVKVEIREGSTYITCKDYPGAGGLPVGTGGKVALMLSGGIDSPVSAYMLMKRGVQIHAVHFHSPPFTSERAKQKVIDLCRVLTRFGGKITLHVVPFTKLQQHIHEKIPANYTMTAMRRMMLRITEQIARKNEALAIGTGENLGQVASQTLESMHTINEVTNYPVLRPLLTMDKVDIIKISKEIGTYEISIRPYEDCCTIFLHPSPKTKPRREKINQYESYLAADALIDEALAGIETIQITEQMSDPVDSTFKDLL